MRLQKGEAPVSRSEQYIEALYTRHQRFLHALCRQKTGYDRAYDTLIEDCIQETFLLAYQNCEALQAHPNPQAWLARTCLNRLLPYAQQQRRRQSVVALNLESGDALSVADEGHSTDAFIRGMDVRAFQASLLTALTPQEERVFAWYFLQEETMQATAEALGVTMNQVRVDIRHIRQKARLMQSKLQE